MRGTKYKMLLCYAKWKRVPDHQHADKPSWREIRSIRKISLPTYRLSRYTYVSSSSPDIFKSTPESIRDVVFQFECNTSADLIPIIPRSGEWAGEGGQMKKEIRTRCTYIGWRTCAQNNFFDDKLETIHNHTADAVEKSSLSYADWGIRAINK